MNTKIVLKIFVIILLFYSFSFAETITVITKNNAIRESPKFFSPVKIFVKYGDVLNVLSIERDWYKVKFRNYSGYIHKSAVEKRVVALKTGSYQGSSTSEGEITLAGKGFNPEVERVYKNKNPQMRYDLVEKVEKIQISEMEILSFIKTGGLSEPQ